MWIGTDDKGCGHDQIYSAMCIGMDVKGIFHDEFELIYALQQI
jgi:hypothetical protein